MNKQTATKTFSVIALIAAAVASQAFSFATEQIGNFTTTTTSGVTSVNDTFNVFVTAGSFVFTTGTMTYSYTGTPGSAPLAVGGTLTLYGTSTSDYMSFSFAGDIFGGAVHAESLAGFATLTGSGGAYAMYNSGTGNLSNTSLILGTNGSGVKSGSSYGAFAADVEAVPEPVGMATLGLGLAALIRRRKASK